MLINGTNEPSNRYHILTEYQKGKPVSEIAAMLPDEFVGGRGFETDGGKVCAWYGEDGIHLTRGNAARSVVTAQVISWETAAESCWSRDNMPLTRNWRWLPPMSARSLRRACGICAKTLMKRVRSMTPNDVVVHPNTIYCLLDKWEYGKQMLTLLKIDRSSGRIENMNIDNVISISPYKDNLLLLLKRDNRENTDLMFYNENTQESKLLYPQLGTEIEKIRYLPTEDWPIWLDGRRIMAYTSDGKAQQIGYSPSPYFDTFELMNNQIACLAGKSISISEISSAFNEGQVLTIYGNGDLNNAVVLLREKHPDLQLYWQNDTEDDMALESMINKILSDDESIDIMVLTVDRSPFISMKEKEYCLDLSGFLKISSAVAAMNPVVTQAVTHDSKVYAVPIEILSWGWYVNRDIMEDMRLTLTDIPTSIEELCVFIDKWNDTWVDEYPNYMPVEDWNDIRKKCFQQLSPLIRMYMKHQGNLWFSPQICLTGLSQRMKK